MSDSIDDINDFKSNRDLLTFLELPEVKSKSSVDCSWTDKENKFSWMAWLEIKIQQQQQQSKQKQYIYIQISRFSCQHFIYSPKMCAMTHILISISTWLQIDNKFQ